MSFNINVHLTFNNNPCFNPFGTGQCLSTPYSLKDLIKKEVSIPLEQGNVFRPKAIIANVLQTSVSIPLEQGNVFRQKNIA